jgi:putative membrane protein
MSDLRLLWLTMLLLPILAWSGIGPHDRMTWWLEIAPVLIGLPIAWAVARRFPLSNLLLLLLGIHAVILIVGGHYTYARVPLGEWAKDWFGWSRNNYDKIGHLAQGFIPAILVREILLRASPLRLETIAPPPPADDEPPAEARVESSKWTGFLVVSVCLAFSAFYELIEWWAALLAGSAADDFLGTQGYEWDTQSDMAWALGGAIAALLLLSRVHDRSLLKAEAIVAARRDDY